MAKFKLMLLMIFTSSILSAQGLKNDTLFMPVGLRQYQFQLEKPVKAINRLQYEKSGEAIKGFLTPDGSRVVMDNYKKGQRIKVQLINFDGKTEDYTKSPCFIDPVSYDL